MSSSHTDEEILQAAKRIAVSQAESETLIVAQELVIELNKPAIHPDVPVMYRSDAGDWYVSMAGHCPQDDALDLIVLIPEETARRLAAAAWESMENMESFLRRLDERYADYRPNGPGDSHD